MNKGEVIASAKDFVNQQLMGESSGHDAWHVIRVWKTAKAIAEIEGANVFIVELSALLHDVYDWKFYDEEIRVFETRKWLYRHNVSDSNIAEIIYIIENISYKGNRKAKELKTIEAKIVQDADRLDALGAIGIARAFAYGGHKDRQIYDPYIPTDFIPNVVTSSSPSTIHHFYEKLLLLKNEFHTKTATELAMQRHEFIKEFLNQFYLDWNLEISSRVAM
jgi:uncharacterized protein